MGLDAAHGQMLATGNTRHHVLSEEDCVAVGAAENSFWVGGAPRNSRGEVAQPNAHVAELEPGQSAYVCHGGDGSGLRLRDAEDNERAVGLRVAKRELGQSPARDLENSDRLNLIPSLLPLGDVRTEQVHLEIVEATECLAGLSGPS